MNTENRNDAGKIVLNLFRKLFCEEKPFFFWEMPSVKKILRDLPVIRRTVPSAAFLLPGKKGGKRFSPAFCFFLFCFASNGASANDGGSYCRGNNVPGWLPDGSVSCEVQGKDFDLGSFGAMTEFPRSFTENLLIDCKIKAHAHPRLICGGHPTYVEANTCLTIDGERSLEKEGKSGDTKIPFKFHKEKSAIEIGNGIFGAPLITRERKFVNDSSKPTSISMNPPVGIRLEAVQGMTLPAGVYSRWFTVRMQAGIPKDRGEYPPENNRHSCNHFPSGVKTARMQVKLTVKKYCNVNVMRHIDFGTHGSLSSDVFAQGAIAVDCSADTKFETGLNAGLHGSTSGQRFLKNSQNGQTVRYDLYQDSARTRPWTNAWGTPNVLNGKNSGDKKQYEIYATVPRQPVSTGEYSDNVIVEVKIIDDGT